MGAREPLKLNVLWVPLESWLFGFTVVGRHTMPAGLPTRRHCAPATRWQFEQAEQFTSDLSKWKVGNGITFKHMVRTSPPRCSLTMSAGLPTLAIVLSATRWQFVRPNKFAKKFSCKNAPQMMANVKATGCK